MANKVEFQLAIEGGAEVGAVLQDTSRAIEKTTATWEENMRGVGVAMRETALASTELSVSAQRIMDRYDPLGTKLRSLTTDMALMRREMGNSSTDGAIKAFQGLEAEIEKTQALMATAGVAGSDGFKQAADAADKSAFATAGAKRELMVLGHEAMTGNFSRMPGSFMVLAERMSMTEALMSPITLGLVAVGAATVGVVAAMVQGAHEQKAMNDALILTGNYAGLTSDGLNALAHAAVATGGSIASAKQAVTELAGTGKYTGEQIGVITNAAVAMEHATGQSIEKTIKDFESLAVQATGHSGQMTTAISEGAMKQNEKYHFLTLAVYDQIRALEKEGDMKAASVLATNEMARVTDARTKEIETNVGHIGRAWKGVKDDVGAAIDAVNNWGKSATAATEVGRIAGVIAQLQAGRSTLPGKDADLSRASTDAKLAEQTKLLIIAKENLARVNERAADQQAVALTNEREVNAANAIDAMLKNAQAHSQDALTTALKKYRAELANLPPGDPRNDPAVVAAAEAALTKQYGEKAKAIKHMSDAWQSESLRLYASTMDSLAKAQEVAAAKAEGLSKAQEALRVIEASPHWPAFSRQQQEQIIYAASLAQASEDEVTSKEAAKKASEAYTKQIDSLGKARDTELKQLDAAIAKQNEHNAQIGMTKAQIDMLKQSQEDQGTVELENQAQAIELLLTKGQIMAENGLIEVQVSDKARGIYELELDRLNQVIAKRRQLSAAYQQGAYVDASKATDDELKKTADKIDTSITDSIMRGFENGKGFIQNFGDTLVAAAKTWILQPMIKAVMSPISQGLTGMLGMSGSAGAATGASGGGWSGMLGAAGINTGYFTNIGAASVGGLSSMGANLYSKGFETIGSGMMDLGNGLAKYSSEITATGNALGYASALYAASQGKWGTAIGAGIGTYFGGPIGAWIGSKIGGWVDSYFGGETRSGGTYKYNPADGTSFSNGPSGGQIAGDTVKQAINSTVSAINGVLTAVGSQAHISGFIAGLETSDNNRGGVMAGGTLSSGAAFGQNGSGSVYSGNYYDPSKSFNMDAKAAGDAFGLELDQVKVKALQAAVDLPKIIASMLKDANGAYIDASQLKTDEVAALLTKIDAVVTDVLSFQDAVKTLPFRNLTSLSFDAAAGLIAAAGGMDKLGSNLNAYYSAFYSSEEQRAQTIKNINATVAGSGFDAATATREQFRALVDAQNVTTESGAKMYAALISVAGAFDQLNPAAKQAAAAIVDTAAATAALAKTNQALQNQLDILTGKQTDLSIALRDAADISTAILIAQVDAQTKINEATAQAASEARALKDALTSAGSGLAAFIQTLRGATQSSSLAQTRATYNADLALAQAGNVDASNRLPSSGKAYIDAQIALAASAVDVQRASALMANQLSALPATKSYEQQMLDAIAGTTQAVSDLNGKLVTELTVTARSEIVKAISIIGSSDQTDDLKRLALLDTATVSHTIDLILGADLSSDAKRLALDAAAAFTRVIDIAAGSTVSDTQKALALDSASAFYRVINVVSGSDLSDEQKIIALNEATVFSRVMNIVAGTSLSELQISLAQDAATAFQRTINIAQGSDLDEMHKALALGQATADFNRTINALGGTLTEEQKLLLNGQTDYKKLVTIDTVVATSSQAAPAITPQTPTGSVYTIKSWNAAGDPLLVASDGSSIGWYAGMSMDSLKKVFDGDMASSYQAGTAMYAAMAAYGHDIGLPGFAVGTNLVPYDMNAKIHKDERIVPAADNRELMARLRSPQGNNNALATEIKALREELKDALAKLAASSERGNVNTQIAADRLSGRQGVPFLVQVAP